MKIITWELDIQNFVRSVLTGTFALFPILFDPLVPEAAGDIRWFMAQMVTEFCFGIILIRDLTQITIRQPIKASLVPLIFLTIFCLWTCVCAIWTQASFASIQWLESVWAGVGLIYLIYRLRQRHWYQQLQYAAVPGFIFNSLLGIAQFYDLHDPTLFETWRISFIDFFTQASPPAASFAHKNIAAAYVILMMPMVVGVFVGARSLIWRALCLFGISSGLVFLICTRSRAAWIALIIVGLVAGGGYAYHNRGRLTFSYRNGVLLLCLALAMTIGANLNSPLIGLRAVNQNALTHLASLIEAEPDETFRIRWAYDLNAMAMIYDHPITGIGPGAFPTIYPLYHDRWIDTPRHGYDLNIRPQRLHNDVLQIFVELGIPGGMILILFAWTLGRRALRHLKSAKDRQEYTTILALVISLLAIALDALMDFPFHLPTVPIISCMMVGMILGYADQQPLPIRAHFSHRTNFANAFSGILLIALIFQADAFLTNRMARHLVQQAMNTPLDDYGLKAKQAIDLAYKFAPNDPLVRNALGLIYANLERGTNVSPAIRLDHIKLALEYDPQSPAHLVNAGLLYAQQASDLARTGAPIDQIEPPALAALKIAQQIKRVAPFAGQGPAIEGFSQFALGHLVQAEAAFAKALEIDPGFASQLHAMLGEK